MEAKKSRFDGRFRPSMQKFQKFLENYISLQEHALYVAIVYIADFGIHRVDRSGRNEATMKYGRNPELYFEASDSYLLRICLVYLIDMLSRGSVFIPTKNIDFSLQPYEHRDALFLYLKTISLVDIDYMTIEMLLSLPIKNIFDRHRPYDHRDAFIFT